MNRVHCTCGRVALFGSSTSGMSEAFSAEGFSGAVDKICTDNLCRFGALCDMLSLKIEEYSGWWQ